MTEVKCKVSSCHFWGSSDICKADTILVDHDEMRSDTTRMEASALNLNLDDRLFGDSKDSRELRDLDNLGDSRNVEGSKDLGDSKNLRDSRNLRDPRELRDQRDSRDRRQFDALTESKRLDTGMLGGMTSQHEKGARTSEATCCRTFKPKGSP